MTHQDEKPIRLKISGNQYALAKKLSRLGAWSLEEARTFDQRYFGPWFNRKLILWNGSTFTWNGDDALHNFEKAEFMRKFVSDKMTHYFTDIKQANVLGISRLRVPRKSNGHATAGRQATPLVRTAAAS